MTNSSFRVLVFGDVFGRLGRNLVHKHISELKKQYEPDFLIANSENMTDGRAASVEHIREFESLGFDCLTGGNHSLARIDETKEELNREASIQIRPANYYENASYKVPGRGYRIIEKAGKRLLVINLISSVYIKEAAYNPFFRADEILSSLSGEKFDGVFVDFHRETTAEAYCMAEYLSGRATFVYGTHTHVQTNDEHILSSGTGMICDVGMTGPLHSSIGHTFESRLPQIVTGLPIFWERPTPVKSGDGSLHAILVTVSQGKCIELEKIRIRELT